MKTKIETPNAPKAIGPYSQGIQVGTLVYTAGQIPTTPDGALLEGSIEEQTRQVMKNLNAILEAAGATFNDVVKTTVYVTDLSDYARINAVYKEYFSEPFPAREAVEVKALPKGAKIEISMIAVKSDSANT